MPVRGQRALKAMLAVSNSAATLEHARAACRTWPGSHDEAELNAAPSSGGDIKTCGLAARFRCGQASDVRKVPRIDLCIKGCRRGRAGSQRAGEADGGSAADGMPMPPKRWGGPGPPLPSRLASSARRSAGRRCTPRSPRRWRCAGQVAVVWRSGGDGDVGAVARRHQRDGEGRNARLALVTKRVLSFEQRWRRKRLWCAGWRTSSAWTPNAENGPENDDQLRDRLAKIKIAAGITSA